MSLLMDALRRAEEAKRAGSRRMSAEPLAELSLEEPDTPQSVKPSRRSALAAAGLVDAPAPDESELTLDNAPFSAQPANAAVRAKAKVTDSDPQQANERNAARNIFAVKQAPRSRLPLWSFLALVAVSTIGLVGYFWWQVQAISSPPPVRPNRPATVPAATTPVAAANPLPQNAAESSPVAGPAPPATVAQPPSEAKAVLPEVNMPPPETKIAAKPASIPPRTPRMRIEDAPPESANVRLLRPTTSRVAADRTLETAYKAWQADRLEEARRLYEQVLRNDARNVDALLGLAAIATRQGQSERAQQWYQRVLEADPGEVTAQAALINLRAQQDGGQSESRLRTLLASQPESAALHFSLGNVFARQQRWKDAQQAYFQAYALEPDNADYLFNVAVSLDHLRQDKLAAQYYRLALETAEKSRGTFDRNQAVRRVAELQP